jgi:hypothetical protein
VILFGLLMSGFARMMRRVPGFRPVQTWWEGSSVRFDGGSWHNRVFAGLLALVFLAGLVMIGITTGTTRGLLLITLLGFLLLHAQQRALRRRRTAKRERRRD